ncbi:MAG TPA: hypothetical protein VNI55_08420 [Gaiellaceae bacterium]|nr:hypothetical protein [Gaiellaceae bacterium]
MDGPPAAEELFYPRTLAEAAELREIVARIEIEYVGLARAQGFSWADIGVDLGLSRQTAHRRFAAAVRR